MFRFIPLIAILALLSACVHPVGQREGTGALLGAGTGALIGSQFGSGEGRLVGAAIGTLAGALIGQDVGRTLDQVDRQSMQRTVQQSLELAPTNQTKTWVNPDTGNSGSVTPTQTFQNQDGRYCREYQQTVTVGGKQRQAYGTACRQADGSWQINNAQPAAPVRQPVVTHVYSPYDPYGPYDRPIYLWPYITSLSFSFGHFSGHHGGWGHYRGRGHHDGWND
nr:RT0821/Lpp0805 family surface protein [Geopsychrobacter electrodiphilus]